MHASMYISSTPWLQLGEHRPIAHAGKISKPTVQCRPLIMICSKVAVSRGHIPGQNSRHECRALQQETDELLMLTAPSWFARTISCMLLLSLQSHAVYQFRTATRFMLYLMIRWSK